MNITDILNILNKDKTCALPYQEITIVTHGDGIHKKKLYHGKAIDCNPKQLEGGTNWGVFSFNPDYTKRTKENVNIPDYNLPYLIEVF